MLSEDYLPDGKETRPFQIMNAHTITFTPQGTAHCLWTEALPLQELGLLEITRASTIEFDQDKQEWEVRDSNNQLLYSHPSRNTCLEWEHKHFNQLT
jgi:hypothetical protein